MTRRGQIYEIRIGNDWCVCRVTSLTTRKRQRFVSVQHLVYCHQRRCVTVERESELAGSELPPEPWTKAETQEWAKTCRREAEALEDGSETP